MGAEKYTPNSNKYKARIKEQEESKKVSAIVKSGAKTKKKNSLKNVFISEDASQVKNYVFMDVLVPAIKKAVSDIVRDGIDMILYGKVQKRSGYSGSKVSYRSYYDDRKEDRYSSRPSSFDYDDIVVNDRAEAEAVLDMMQSIIDEYGHVTVSDLYDLVDLSAPYTANKYGWTSLGNARAERLRDGGYLLALPRAKVI